MLKVVIVEDEKKCIDTILSYLHAYELDKHISITVETYSDGINFLDDYKGGADLIYMDIAMPQMNGLSVAKELRKKDSLIGIIFITTLGQYAVKGYEVNALDFLIKPVPYELFCIKLDKALKYIQKKIVPTFMYSTPTQLKKIPFNEITFIESREHYIIIHTVDGSEYKLRASLSDTFKLYDFENNDFAFANRSVLVNLSYVDGFEKNELTINGEIITIGRTKKKEFLDKLTSYVCGGIG